LIIAFDRNAWEEYLHWQAADRTILERINSLIEECRRHPFAGTGKPEPLKSDLAGFWSRRITQEHRLVYRVSGKGEGQTLQIAQCRYHYD
jgi:toxin YoeB